MAVQGRIFLEAASAHLEAARAASCSISSRCWANDLRSCDTHASHATRVRVGPSNGNVVATGRDTLAGAAICLGQQCFQQQAHVQGLNVLSYLCTTV